MYMHKHSYKNWNFECKKFVHPKPYLLTQSHAIRYFKIRRRKRGKEPYRHFAFMSSNLENLTSSGCCSIKKKQNRKLEKDYQENTIKLKEWMNQSGKKKLQRDLPAVCVIGSLRKGRDSVSQLKEAQQIIATVHNR